MVQSLGQEDLLGEEMATHSRILAWRIPWTDQPGGLQSMSCKELGTTQCIHTHTHTQKYSFLVFTQGNSEKFISLLADYEPDSVLPKSRSDFFFFDPAARHTESYFPDQGSNLCPLQQKYRVLTTGQAGKSLEMTSQAFSNLKQHQYF